MPIKIGDIVEYRKRGDDRCGEVIDQVDTNVGKQWEVKFVDRETGEESIERASGRSLKQHGIQSSSTYLQQQSQTSKLQAFPALMAMLASPFKKSVPQPTTSCENNTAAQTSDAGANEENHGSTSGIIGGKGGSSSVPFDSLAVDEDEFDAEENEVPADDADDESSLLLPPPQNAPLGEGSRVQPRYGSQVGTIVGAAGKHKFYVAFDDEGHLLPKVHNARRLQRISPSQDGGTFDSSSFGINDNTDDFESDSEEST